MKSDKISEELKAHLEQAMENELISVLVTTKEVVKSITPFEAKGLQVRRNIESISLLSGTIKVSQLDALISMPEVKKVEFDSEITTQ